MSSARALPRPRRPTVRGRLNTSTGETGTKNTGKRCGGLVKHEASDAAGRHSDLVGIMEAVATAPFATIPMDAAVKKDQAHWLVFSASLIYE